MVSLPNWYFDESKMAGVDFEDAAQAESFDLKQPSSTPEKEQALVSRLGITSGQIVIDLGAGTGTFAIQASLTGASIHAVDISQAMLTYARNKAHKAGATNIQFHRAGFFDLRTLRSLSRFGRNQGSIAHPAGFLEDGGIFENCINAQTQWAFLFERCDFFVSAC